jgi:hypothetical protein
MNALDHHEAWEMKPRKLSVDEIESPHKVVEDFFQFAHLPQARWYLWESMKTMVTGTFSDLKRGDRCTLLCFFEQIEKLIEGIHVIHERNQSKSA